VPVHTSGERRLKRGKWFGNAQERVIREARRAVDRGLTALDRKFEF
jgi:hypothetical protein